LTPAQNAKLRKMEKPRGALLPNIFSFHYLFGGIAADLQRLFCGGAKWRGQKYQKQSKQVLNEDIKSLRDELRKADPNSTLDQKYCRQRLLRCLKHLEEAQNADSPNQARDAHHRFLKAYRAAAKSPFYQEHKRETTDAPAEVRLIQLLSANLFDGVNLQKFARKTVNDVASHGNSALSESPGSEQSQGPNSEIFAKKALAKLEEMIPSAKGPSLYEKVAKAKQERKVGLLEDLQQDMRGEVSSKYSPVLDSHAQGNLPSVNHTLKLSGSDPEGRGLDLRALLAMSVEDLKNLPAKDMLAAQELVSNRMPVPTIGSHKGCKINPEFKARLDAMIVVNAKIKEANTTRAERGQDKLPELRHLYINLQDARPTNKIGTEQYRVQALRTLAGEEGYKDVFKLFTMAKNTEFSHGNFTDIGHENCAKANFWQQVENEWFNEDTSISGFEWPEDLSREDRWTMFNKVKDLLDPFCKETMGQGDRQSLIELSYTLLTLMTAQKLGCSSFNATCKDGIDRGGGAQALLHSFILATEIYSDEASSKSAEIEKAIENLHMMMFFPALNARKREPVGERIDAHVQASKLLFNTLADMAPQQREDWITDIRKACGVEGVRHQD
jgi:hypothetical protein